MTLAEWLTAGHSQEQIIDTLAQLLTMIADGQGTLVCSQLSLELPDDAPYGTVCREGAGGAYPSNLRPLRPTNTPADDVFVAGLMLSVLLTGQYPDLEMAEMLLISAQTGGAVPLLHAPTSALNPLLEQLTDVNAATRISAQAALDWLAGFYHSTAVVCLRETETQAELERQTIGLQAGQTAWTPPESLASGGQTLYPVDGTTQLFPYRVQQMTYVCAYAATRPVVSVKLPGTAAAGMRGLGLDIGSERVTIALLQADAQGICTEASGLPVTIPSVLAYASDRQPVFGTAAEQLCADTAATLCHCILPECAPDAVLSATAADGASVQTTYAQQLEAFFAHLRRQIQEQFGDCAENAPCGLAVPTGSPLAFQTALRRAAQANGMAAQMLAGAAAVGRVHLATAEASKPILVLDAGAQAVTGCMAQDAVSSDGADGQLVYAPGGNAMTDVLYRTLVQTLNVRHGIALYQQADSGLSPLQFSENQARVRAAAERMKRQLSFAARADAELSLHCDRTHTQTVSLSVTRTQYDNLISGLMTQVRTAIQQCCHAHSLTVPELGGLLLTGGASITPAFQAMAEGVVRGTSCPCKCVASAVAAARGAALIAAQKPPVTADAVTETTQDYGTMTMNAVNGLPLFCCLLPAGTPFREEQVTFTTCYALTAQDVDAAHQAVYKLYTRRRGMSHVTSTLDPQGAAIAYLGQIRMTVPAQYAYPTDQLRVCVTVNSLEQVTVSVTHLRKCGGMQRLLRKVGLQKDAAPDGYALLGEVPAAWIAKP